MALIETERDGVVDPTAQIVASAGNGSTVLMPTTPRPAVAAAEPAPVRATGSLVWTALAVDSLMLAASVFITVLLTRRSDLTEMSVGWLIAFGAVTLATLYKHGAYNWRVRLQILDDLRRIVTATVLAIAVVLALRVLLGRTEDVSGQSIRLWILATAGLAAGRLAL